MAKEYIASVFREEGAFNVGLEEIVYEGDNELLEVTAIIYLRKHDVRATATETGRRLKSY